MIEFNCFDKLVEFYKNKEEKEIVKIIRKSKYFNNNTKYFRKQWESFKEYEELLNRNCKKNKKL